MPSRLVLKLALGALLTLQDREVLERMVGNGQWIGARQDLIRQGDRPENVHVVLEGFACRYKILPSGGRQIMALLVPGDFCDLRIFLLGAMDHGIATLSACRIARVPRRVIDDLTANRPAITRALWWATLVDEAILREWLVSMGRRAADKQMAHLFCELLVRLQAVGLATENAYEFPLTQIELGDTLGHTLVHVNRVLQQFRADGLITLRSRRLTIHNVPRLKAFAEFDPNYLHLQGTESRSADE